VSAVIPKFHKEATESNTLRGKASPKESQQNNQCM